MKTLRQINLWCLFGLIVSIAGFFSLLVSCGGNKGEIIRVDGSSTVFPITEAVAEDFQKQHGIRAIVKFSGTGGGFKKYIRGDTDINDASRTIKPVELESAKENGVSIIELPVAYDGISVVVHPENDWVDYLTVEELKKIWEPGSDVENWNQVRSDFPDRPIKLYGPGTASGTFDYFTDAIVGEEGRSRTDYSANEDDNVLVTGVSGDQNALGYFGYAYYSENTEKLKVVPIKQENGDPVKPTLQTIAGDEYKPLARPLFIYVRPKAAERPGVEKFIQFYLDNAPKYVKQAGYVPLPEELYDLVKKRFDNRVEGTMFGEDVKPGLSLKERLKP